MSEQTLLLTPDDPAWDAWVERAAHDVYHRAAYHQHAEDAGEGRAFMVVHQKAGRFLAWPYLIRPAGESSHDAYSVYGYPGPLGQGLEDDAFVQRAWQAARSVWSEQGLVALFTRFHPLLKNDRICAELHGAAAVEGGEIIVLGRSVSMDLARGIEARRSGYRQALRQEIKRAERAGLIVEDDPAWRFLPEFGAFYRHTMERNGASETYFFSDRYLDELAQSLGGHMHFLPWPMSMACRQGS